MCFSRLEVWAGFWCATSLAALGLPAPGDEHWAPQFGPVGVDGLVYGVTSAGGKIYVGGQFIAAGNSRANFIAGYDGTNWFPLNNGVSGELNATYVFGLAHDNQYVYVGGWFTNADGLAAANVARWEGSNWSVMGAGFVNGIVLTLKMMGTNLYAGGIFQNNNGVTINCLARWAGSAWSIVPGDFTGSPPVAVEAVETDGTNIFVGGQFDGVAGMSSVNAAAWNGSTWTPMPLGAGGIVRTLLFQGNQLYVGGAFTNTTAGFTNTAVWNGSSWSPWANANNPVYDLISDGSSIYVGGQFTTIGPLATTGIAKWDGVNWSALGAGLQGFGIGSARGVFKMAFDSAGRLVAAGNFNVVDGVGVSHVAIWDGNRWSALGAATSKGLTHSLGQVYTLYANGNTLYAGGLFTEAGDQVVNHIGAWDGTNWSAVGGGVSGASTSGFAPIVRCFAFMGGNLYAGGSFANAGPVPANNIAYWDGASWWPLGNGPDSTVRALATDGTLLYVGGPFTNVDGLFSPGLAIWDGTAWAGLGTLSGGGRNVAAIAVDGSDVYVGGSFTSIAGLSLLNVARWDGSQWYPLGSGMNGSVTALAVTNGVLYAGGGFTSAGGVPANRIAKWDGSTWTALGSGVTGLASFVAVAAIAFRGNDIFIGGSFTNAGNVVATGVAKWDGSNWSALGSGLDADVGTPSAAGVAILGDDLYVGGNLNFAGDKPAMFIAHWNDQLNFYPPPFPRLVNMASLPNGQFQFRLSGTSGEQYILEASTDLATWTPLLTNTATLYDYTDTAASSFPSRFYRAVLTP